MFYGEDNVGTERVTPYISGQKSNSMSQLKVCSIFSCFQLSILCPSDAELELSTRWWAVMILEKANAQKKYAR
jgi:hypothetical protein